ncbi:MAG TPA: hypothetical protein VFE82_07155 [Ramlibacter sp.]|uniref:hypothetical protein n=1 Tax=Ramlibacter sp. TaxID=1917967 RepID=UPI002D43FFD5|nr:hypothetical protein [Ramlibacter sp.]HZY18243.1 hypothetical protein [Ramlibacter sp.]
MERTYSVALEDGRALPAPERIAAEVRFIRALQVTLGDPDQVVATYRAWMEAWESQAQDVDRGTAALAVRWPDAYGRASQVALACVFGLEAAAFHIRLDH